MRRNFEEAQRCLLKPITNYIPEIIEADEKNCVCKTLYDKEYIIHIFSGAKTERGTGETPGK